MDWLIIMHILIVEDNPDILANLYGYLEPLGYSLDCATNGFAALSLAAASNFDVIVLDLMLPGLDGLDVCRKLRKELLLATPILMLTARDSLQDKVVGLESGADDYLIKPFSMIELDARIKALVRRSRNTVCDDILSFGPLRLDPKNYEISRENQLLELTPTGYKILSALLRVAPQVVDKETLEREIWGENPPDSAALRTHIHGLRLVLDKPFAVPMLKTIQHVGYRLVDSDE